MDVTIKNMIWFKGRSGKSWVSAWESVATPCVVVIRRKLGREVVSKLMSELYNEIVLPALLIRGLI